MILKKIDHLGIAVKSIEESLPLWVEAMGLKYLYAEVIEEQGVKVAVLANKGEHVELIQPLNENSHIAKFLKKRGPGIHHTCFLVDDIQAALVQLQEKGFELIDKKPKKGAGGCKIAFIHPKSCDGTLIELKEL